MNKNLFKIGAFLMATSAGVSLTSFAAVKVAEEIDFQIIKLKKHIEQSKVIDIDHELEKLRKETKKN